MVSDTFLSSGGGFSSALLSPLNWTTARREMEREIERKAYWQHVAKQKSEHSCDDSFCSFSVLYRPFQHGVCTLSLASISSSRGSVYSVTESLQTTHRERLRESKGRQTRGSQIRKRQLIYKRDGQPLASLIARSLAPSSLRHHHHHLHIHQSPSLYLFHLTSVSHHHHRHNRHHHQHSNLVLLRALHCISFPSLLLLCPILIPHWSAVCIHHHHHYYYHHFITSSTALHSLSHTPLFSIPSPTSGRLSTGGGSGSNPCRLQHQDHDEYLSVKFWLHFLFLFTWTTQKRSCFLSFSFPFTCESVWKVSTATGGVDCSNLLTVLLSCCAHWTNWHIPQQLTHYPFCCYSILHTCHSPPSHWSDWSWPA